jgi:ubiquinone/menaquinone biosynthesis C-methylase UbiE
MQTREEVMGLLARMSETAWAHQTLRALVESGAIAQLSEPRTASEIATATKLPAEAAERALDVLVALGLARREGVSYVASQGLMPLLSGPGLMILRSDVTGTLLQSAAFAQSARQGELSLGWSFTDPDILQAQGDLSQVQFEMIARQLFPQMPGLTERLEADGGMLLDIGCGVAGLAIGFCRTFPKAEVVGLEPAPVPLELARMNVTAAGLDERIELRHERVESLDEDSVYDLVWLPQMFLPDDVFSAALPRVLKATKPGGWLMTGAMSAPGEGLGPAIARLRNALWGGRARQADIIMKQIDEAGYAKVMQLPGPTPAMQPIVAQR